MFKASGDDIILVLGISGCIALPLLKWMTKSYIVVNIDGLEWKRAKWNGFIKRFLKISEFFAIRFSDCVVADNKVIQEYISSEYNRSSCLIPYGADHVKPYKLTDNLLQKFKFLNSEYAFKVCRIEPENNLDMILCVFSEIPSINLVIVGNWDKSNYGINLKQQYSKFENLFLLNPIYEQHLLNQIRSNCCFYVHGHSAGGTNPSLVEAMFLGLPIIAFGVNFNRASTFDQALYFNSAEDLAFLIKNIHTYDLNLLGEKMHNLAIKNYTWKIVSDKYREIFLNA